MTREEAINHLKTVAKSAVDSGYGSAVVDAVDMAIKALEQEPCEDCISRQAVLENAINVPIAKIVTEDKVICRKVIFADDIEKLPSVTPQPKQEPCEVGIKMLLPECEDAVSREAVEDIVMWYDGQGEMLDEIQKLPSVQPKQKTGHWIEHPHEAGENWEYSRYKCSECHVWEDDDSDYCPNCGAKMVEPQGSEVEE